MALARPHVAPGTVVHADEAGGWDALHAHYEARRINHSVAFSLNGACTNQAESYFSRLRRAEWGQHHHISGKYLAAYAGEMAWREDTRRRTNGALHEMATGAALNHPVSRMSAAYWQRGSLGRLPRLDHRELPSARSPQYTALATGAGQGRGGR